MKGNELIVLAEGDVRGATIISSKRVSAMEAAAKILHQKKIIDSEHSIDLDSPYIRKMMEYIFGKIQNTFSEMFPDKKDSDINDIFFSKIVENTKNWKKEVRKEFDILRERLKMVERDQSIGTDNK
jgi:hypothetical protein